MKTKIIKGSQRGLTFSFPSEGALKIGSTYDYIVDKTNGIIRIVASKNGKYKMSRKKRGDQWYSLVDLRNKDVLDALAGSEQLQLTLAENSVLVKIGAQAKAEAKIIEIPRRILSNLRMAAGVGPADAVESLLTGTQISLDEYLATRRAPMNISDIHRNLADVYTVVSLFSGAGILDWPFFNDPRFSIQYAIDYEASACDTYRRNIGMHIVHGDIHRAFTNNGYALDETIKDPDVIIGGPSCKPFSNSNRHTRLDDHPDSDLLVQYMRIVKVLRPKVFAIENVPSVLTACDGAYFDAVKECAAESGYQLSARVVQDNLVGGYTTRRRAIIIGSRVGPASFPKIALAKGLKTAGDALRKITPKWTNFGDVTQPGEETRKRMSFVPQGGNYESIPEEFRTKSEDRHSCTYRRLAMNEPSPTQVNWRKPPLIHPTEDRTLTVAEAKALQGLPGEYRIMGKLGQMQQQVGNAVPVAMGTYIKNVLIAILQAADAKLIGEQQA